MDTFTTILLIIFGFCICLLLTVQIRNEWVYKQRTKLNRHENGIHVITQYIDYNQMMLKFWIWDVEKMRNDNINRGE